MHCPNCGVQATLDQKFCRGCGFGLEKFSELMTEQTRSPERASVGENPGSKMEIVGRIGLGALVAGGAMFYLYLLSAIVTRLMIEQGQIFTPIALILFFTGAMLLLAYIYYAESQKAKLKLRSASPATESNGAVTTKKLSPSNFSDFVSSVTDRTTDLLEEQKAQIEKKRRSGELRSSHS